MDEWRNLDPEKLMGKCPSSIDLVAIFGPVSMGEAATRDIVWNGLPAPQSSRVKQKVSRDVSVRDS